MVKSEDSIWYKKYSMELRERQFLQNQLEKLEFALDIPDPKNGENVPYSSKISEKGGNFLENLRSMREIIDKSDKARCKFCNNNLHDVYSQLCLEEKVNLDLR